MGGYPLSKTFLRPKRQTHAIFFIIIVSMKVVGGEVTPPAALAPKCGPLGIPPKKVGEDIQKATTKWKGVKI